MAHIFVLQCRGNLCKTTEELSAQLRLIQIHLRDEIASTGKHYPKMLEMLPVRMF